MALIHVNPTRMELTRLKARLKTARRGHKLLKDKRDDLMKRFLELVRKNKELRERVEAMMGEVYDGFAIASALMSPTVLEEALMLPKAKVEMDVSIVNMMSVDVPHFAFTGLEEPGDLYPYGFATTTGELDDSVVALGEVLPYLLELAQQEKAAQLLADEIEKTRRRVNALEYVQIPDLEETIKHISMRLDENERGNLARLMKVKDMMIAQTRRQT